MACIPVGERCMAKTKYGIKIRLSDSDYIWVAENTRRCDFQSQPLLYSTIEEALEAAKTWGPVAKVEPYY